MMVMNKTRVLSRLEYGSKFIYDLHKSGAKCTNIYRKFSCDVCETIDKPLCKAVKLFIKLEREYYLLQIYDVLLKYIKKMEDLPEWTIHQRRAIQQKLF